MKRNLIVMAALLLGMTTCLTSCFKDKPDTSKEGLYVGIIGFNSELNTKTMKLLNDANKQDMIDFVNGLSMASGTALYHAVNTALDKIEAVTPPQDLINVSVVTFTDGLDLGSYRLNDNYSSEEAYLEAVHNRIHTLKVGEQQVPISAYTIGVRGSDVTDVAEFQQNLIKLSSDNDNVYEVGNMSEVGNIFSQIAQNLYSQSYQYNVTLKTPAPNPGTMIRFTFDNVEKAEDSQQYIEAMYTVENNQGILYEINYVGLQCDNELAVYATSEGMFDNFAFNNLYTTEGQEVQTTFTKQWRWIPSTETWQINSEFSPSGNTDKIEEFRSAIVMLVLDCSSSLNNDFQSVKNAAIQFIQTLNGNTYQGN